MLVYDPTRRTVVPHADVEVFGECDGWRAARNKRGGDWFAYRLVDNRSCLLRDVSESVREVLDSAVFDFEVEETLLEVCELVQLAGAEVRPDEQAEALSRLAQRDDCALLERLMQGARIAGYSEATVLAATLYLEQDLEPLREAALVGVEVLALDAS